MTATGKKEYVAGWCFQGWLTAEELAQVLLDLKDFLEEILMTDPWIQKLPVKSGFFTRLLSKPNAKVLVMLRRSSIIGTTHRSKKESRQEEYIHILLASRNRFQYYDTGAFLAKRLGMSMIRKGYFDY